MLTKNANNNTITIYADGRGAGFGTLSGGLRFRGTLFWDSNIDFNIPFRARIQDKAVLSGGPYIVETTQTGNFSVSISGVADVPIVYANNVAGSTPVLLNFSGTYNDTDVALSRNQSEAIYYFVSEVGITGNVSQYAFVNGAYQLVGFPAGCK